MSLSTFCLKLASFHHEACVLQSDLFVGEGDLQAGGDLGKVTKKQAACVKHVVLALGKLSGQELSALTHAESPWLDARNGCSDDERCTAVIAKQAIKEYYSSSACSNVAFANLTS